MRVVNPIGRKIETKAAANAVMACYCGTDTTFAVARTPNDKCFHCGCSCDMIDYSGTYMHAQVTVRTSIL